MVFVEGLICALIEISGRLMNDECMFHFQNILHMCNTDGIFRISRMLDSSNALRLACNIYMHRSGHLSDLILQNSSECL